MCGFAILTFSFVASAQNNSTASTKYNGYIVEHCPHCGGELALSPQALKNANALGMTVKEETGIVPNIRNPKDKNFKVDGKEIVEKWLSDELQKIQKPPDSFCLLVTPGQSSDYGLMWGEHGVAKYGDNAGYDAFGNVANGTESKLNYDLRTGGKGDQTPSIFDTNPYDFDAIIDNMPGDNEVSVGLGYLNQSAKDRVKEYASVYFNKKSAYASSKGANFDPNDNETIDKKAIDKNLAKTTVIMPSKEMAEEFASHLNSGERGYKPDGSKYSVKTGPHPKNTYTNELNKKDTKVFVGEDCKFRDPTDDDKKKFGFPSAPPSGPGGFPGGEGLGGGGGGGGGGGMEGILGQLMQMLQGLGQQGKQQQQPQFSPTPQPYACPSQISEVCGVNGQTYANACVAEYENNIKVAKQGSCEGTSSSSINSAAQLTREALESGIPESLLGKVIESISVLIKDFAGSIHTVD